MRTAFFAALFMLPAAAFADLHYTLKPDLPAQSIQVALTLDEAAEEVEFRIPAWCPGFYFILNYQDKISDVRATGPGGNELQIERSDSRGWKVANPDKGAVTISYRVLGDDPGLGFFGVNVHPHTVFVNGPAAFMYPEGRLRERAWLKLDLPEGWQVATGMDQDEDGRYVSGDYDELVDHPLQLGHFERRTFSLRGIPFEAVYVSTDQTYRADLDAETERLRRLSIPGLDMFDGAPFPRYVYIIHLATGNFGGGLEHRASTVMAVPNSSRLGIDTLAAHEFFHVWNVKHIRPKTLGPFDYSQQNRTRALWFAEGVTDYYAQLLVYRSGLADQQWLLNQLTREIRQLQRSRARLERTVEDISWNAWETGGFGADGLSYYNKGLVMGLLFDAAIRDATGGEKTLDDVMRYLFERHKLPQPGYEEDGILKAMNALAQRDLSALYKRMAQSTEELPYEVLVGLGLRLGERQTLERDPFASEAARERLREWLKRPE
jgi:predicted metalloprotease with PDZ domain